MKAEAARQEARMSKGKKRRNQLELECAERDLKYAESHFAKVSEQMALAASELKRAQRRLADAWLALASAQGGE